MKLGEKIKKLRKDFGLSIEELAVKANSCKSFIWEVEKGRTSPSVKKLVNIANALKTTVGFLTDESSDQMKRGDREEYFLMKLNRLSSHDQFRLDRIMSIVFEEEDNLSELLEKASKRNAIPTYICKHGTCLDGMYFARRHHLSSSGKKMLGGDL